MKSCREWPPPRRRRPLLVAIPSSIVAVEPSLELATVKASFISRALAVFRVNGVIVYRDEDSTKTDQELLATLLRYIETPPHLRRISFPIIPELAHAGIMPPLRTVSHDPPEEPQQGALVEGYIKEGEPCKVYLGRKLGWWKLMPCDRGLKGRITVRINNIERRTVETADWGDIYSGYDVYMENSLAGAIRLAKKLGLGLIATSRKGECLTDRIEDRIRESYRSRGLAIFFGGPRKGLLDMRGFDYDAFEMVLNLVPLQGTLTVRTEEAVWVSLAHIAKIIE